MSHNIASRFIQVYAHSLCFVIRFILCAMTPHHNIKAAQTFTLVHVYSLVLL